MAVMTNETLKKISDEIAMKNAVIYKFVVKYATNSWERVQEVVRSGIADKVFNIGDELICNYNFAGTSYEFPWIVTAFRDVELEDGEVVPGMVLMAKYATCESLQFDAPEPNNTDSNIKKYGYNRWSKSAYRQWLNSDAPAGEWWKAQSETDVAPSQLNTYAGFIRGLDADFTAVVGTTKIKTATNTVTDGGVIEETSDRFWLPSVEEMYGVPQVSGVEGEYFPYWKEKMDGVSNPTNDANASRIIYALNEKTSAKFCLLRSAYSNKSNSVWSLSTSGSISYFLSASGINPCAPACVIC